MHQFELNEDQLQIQEMARKFTADAITPNAAEWDEKHIFPRDTIREAAELGFGAIYVSEESGGIGLGRLEAALVMDDRPLRLARSEAEISAFDDHDGEDRQLLPDRAVVRIRCGGA
jgi:alkylation response protein AidB-like acyl-CoA dehydrogenase